MKALHHSASAVSTLLAWLLDAVCVLTFVVIGRVAHSHGLQPAGVASTAWPFVSGLAVGWLLIARRRQDPASLRAGSVVWLATVAVGMALRVAARQGIALAFVGVALAFLGLFMLGWRVAAAGGRHRSGTGRVSRPGRLS